MSEPAEMLKTVRTTEANICHEGKTLRILVVDDDYAMNHSAVEILRVLGHEPVCQAYDGEKAVEIFTSEKNTIDAVLMDVNMPRRNGISAAYEIRDLCPSVRIILMSGDPKNEIFASEIENTSFILKPFDMNTAASRLNI